MKRLALVALLAGSLSLQAKVYATVGDKKITEVELNQVLSMMPNGRMIMQFGGIEKLDKKKQKQIIDIAVENYLISKKAKDEGIEKTDEFKKELENIKNSLATKLYVDKITKGIKVTDKDIKTYYEKNKDKFAYKDDMRKARHILVKSEKEAKKIIDELKKAKDVEKKFIELAKSKSTGPSGADGGELGWFNKARMVPEFSKAAFALKKGEWTKKPVKTQFGYHVIYVQDVKNKGDVKPLSELKTGIDAQIVREKLKAYFDKVIKESKAKLKVTYK